MGSVPSLLLQEEDNDTMTPTTRNNTGTEEVIRAMKWRLSRLEADNAIMNRNIANLVVTNKEMKVSLSNLRSKVAMNRPSMEKKNLSVRLPKGSQSMYSK